MFKVRIQVHRLQEYFGQYDYNVIVLQVLSLVYFPYICNLLRRSGGTIDKLIWFDSDAPVPSRIRIKRKGRGKKDSKVKFSYFFLSST